MTPRRRPPLAARATRALIGLVLVVSLTAGCDDGGGSTSPPLGPSTTTAPPTGAPTTTAPGSPSPTATPVDETALPEGPLEVAIELNDRPRATHDEQPGIVFTDREVIVATRANSLVVVDRQTSRVRWRARLPEDDGVCRLQPPARDATTYTVFDGAFCNHLVTYSLADGDVVDDYDNGQFDGVIGLQQVYPTSLDGRLLWAAGQYLREVTPQSSQSIVLPPTQLGLTPQDILVGAVSETAEHVVVLGVNRATGDGRRLERLYLGVDLGGAQARVRWRRTPAQLGLREPLLDDQLITPSQAHGVTFGQTRDRDLVITRFDPARGTLNHDWTTVPARQSDRLGLVQSPKFADYVVAGERLTDRSDRDCVQYDLAARRRAWIHRTPQADYCAPVGPTADGAGTFVLTRSADSPDVLLLDLGAAGEERHRWVLPQDLGSITPVETVAVDGDLVVLARTAVLPGQASVVVMRAAARAGS